MNTNSPPSVRLNDSVFGLRFIALVIGVGLTIAVFVGWLMYLRSNHGIAKPPARVDVDLKALGNFKFNDHDGTLNDIPPIFRALDGRLVALEGFMYASTSSDAEVSSFQLVYDFTRGSFHGPPLVQERVFVTVPGGKRVALRSDEVRIIGIMHVKIRRDADGKVINIFAMDLDHIEQL